MRPILALFSVLLGFASNSAHAGRYVELGGVVLLQPDSVIGPRLRSATELSAYIKQIEFAAEEHFARAAAFPRSGYIVVAIKPAQQSNFWFDMTPALDALARAELDHRLRKVLPMSVKEGPVVFALQVGFGGAKPPTEPMPRPLEWTAEARKLGQAIETGELVLRLWRP